MDGHTLLMEIEKRCKNQGIDTKECLFLIEGRGIYFCGEKIKQYTVSKDERWVCVPVYDEENSLMYGSTVYKPICLEVKEKMTTYIEYGDWITLTIVWLLYKPD